MSIKVVTFGEIMLRLSTPGFERFVQANKFDINYGGGEANVAVSLANYGIESYFVSKTPDNEIGKAAVNSLKRYGVKTDFVVNGGERLGIYFLETGASQRPSKVIYDRNNSALSSLSETEIDWQTLFSHCDWFHFTGITPALGKNLQNILLIACKIAKQNGITISCDLNFRAKLWTEKEAQSVMIPLMKYVDVCIANEEDAEKSLGFKLKHTKLHEAELNEEEYGEMALELMKKFTFKTVAITLRESYSASRNGWSAIIIDNDECKTPYRSKVYDIQIVDRVGGGDSFASGLIYSLVKKFNSKKALEFAVAASCLKQTIPGDFNLLSVGEVELLADGDGSGRVIR